MADQINRLDQECQIFGTIVGRCAQHSLVVTEVGDHRNGCFAVSK